MQKKYIVRLTDQERATLADVAKKLKGTSPKVRRAQILLKADADGPAWTDQQIAEAFSCQRKTVEGICQRFGERGFRETLKKRKRLGLRDRQSPQIRGSGCLNVVESAPEEGLRNGNGRSRVKWQELTPDPQTPLVKRKERSYVVPNPT